MSERLEKAGGNSLESIKSLLNDNCWTEGEKTRGNWLQAGDKRNIDFLCGFLRTQVNSEINSINDTTLLKEVTRIIVRFNTINECISLLDSDSLKPLELPTRLQELSHLLRISENIISPIITETRESVQSALQ